MTTTPIASTARLEPSATAEAQAARPVCDPLSILKGFVGLRRLTGMYPAGHPIITQKLTEIDDAVQRYLQANPAVRIDVIHDDVHLDGATFRADTQTAVQVIRELADLGVDSIHIRQGVNRDELRVVGEFLWQLKDGPPAGPFDAELARRNAGHVSLGRIVSLDTRWRTDQWPDAPTGPIDPSYAESLLLAQQAFDTVAAGKKLDVVTVHDLVELLTQKVARSNAALAQILAVKHYENLTYCHSVNVAMISLLLGRRLGLDTPARAALVEAALLHDIGKTRVPVEIVKKPAALDKRERKIIEGHTIYGAEILVDTDGVQPLTAIVALEHHRSVKGGGYPDLGEGTVPHLLAQIVSVADVYEAITGARSYQPPRPPEQACLVLARQSGSHFNKAVVRAFVNAITFFPIGSVVRTSRGETGVVVRTNPADPLHPVLTLVNEDLDGAVGPVDTSARDASGGYERHIVETISLKEGQVDLARLLPAEPIAA
jgi:putative nucleotidyltransferase with HDIG domain